jgi:hypothetical protein
VLNTSIITFPSLIKIWSPVLTSWLDEKKSVSLS